MDELWFLNCQPVGGCAVDTPQCRAFDVLAHETKPVLVSVVTSLQEIEVAVAKLSAAEFATLYAEMREQHHARWDRQIEQDSDSGALDFLLEELDADMAAGRAHPIDEVCRKP